MDEAISFAASVQFEDSFLLIGGYSNRNHESFANVRQFDPSTETWIVRPEKLNGPKISMAAVLVPEDYVNFCHY